MATNDIEIQSLGKLGINGQAIAQLGRLGAHCAGNLVGALMMLALVLGLA
jgi:hypothetical protein